MPLFWRLNNDVAYFDDKTVMIAVLIYQGYLLILITEQ
ncbi:hypothetical protein CZ794_09915 [Psychrobacter sp. JB385]|nr:hypothetical protein CZ794_09915 [Psychrobacter sp. JB385]